MLNKERKKDIENFKYWIQTNTERGVCTIPDYICINALNLLEKQQEEINKLNNENKKIKYFSNNLFINDYVSKNEIREKIKDLRYNESLGFEQSFEETFKIEVLEELLGDE